MHIRTARQRGVSLIEALIALAVMAIGMLGLVGMQATLRANSDIAKQRAEAVRLAQEAIEDWRSINALSSVAGMRAYEDLVDQTDTPITGINATYTRSRTVRPLDPMVGVPMADQLPRGKSLTVRVTWQDRTSRAGELQSVMLTSAVGGVVPNLATTLSVPGDGDLARRPMGRNRGVPVQAVDLGDGRSAFAPPGAPAGVQWVFNNNNAMITLCSLIVPGGGINAANISCSTTRALLYSGYIRYSITAIQPTTDDAKNPGSVRPAALAGIGVYIDQTAPVASTPPGVACYTDNSVTPATDTPFYCALPVQSLDGATVSLGWSGAARVEPTSLFAAAIGDAPSGKYKLCRYVAQASFTDIRKSLLNQNFLVIADGAGAVPFACPGAGSVTWPHQPAS